MLRVGCTALFFLAAAAHALTTPAELRDRRARATAAFSDGIILVHANSVFSESADGFRQDPVFYYFTGLEDTPGALLAIDGRAAESWLFVPSYLPESYLYSPPEQLFPKTPVPLKEIGKETGIEHVVDWSEMEGFFSQSTSSPVRAYYPGSGLSIDELPPNLMLKAAPHLPAWAVILAARWPSLQFNEVSDRFTALMEVQSLSELADVRAAAKATIVGFFAGLRAISPSVPQRTVEAAVDGACWNAGAHGSFFWPWVFAGENALFPHAFRALVRYDHLSRIIRAGDLVRLDVGCEWNHYQGDLGRTVPASGRFNPAQREVWGIFLNAYRAGAKALRDGATVNQVFEAWRGEIARHKDSARSNLALHAVEAWTKRENVPYWSVHTTSLTVRDPETLRAGMTVDFEPIASVDGQGFYLEDMFLITREGTELLTPGVPYSADEIETALRKNQKK